MRVACTRSKAIHVAGCSTLPRATALHEACGIQEFGWKPMVLPPPEAGRLRELAKPKGPIAATYWFSRGSRHLMVCDIASFEGIDELAARTGCFSSRAEFRVVDGVWSSYPKGSKRAPTTMVCVS